MRRAIVCGLTLAIVVAADAQWDSAGRAWWEHVKYLASDELEGRNVGSQGYDKAARYVAQQFEKAGLKAAGDKGFFQEVGFVETALDPMHSHLSLDCGRETRVIAVPGEAQLGYSQNSASNLKAPVVFAGYALAIPEAHYDDFASLPIKGAVVAYLMGGPESIDGNLRSHYSSGDRQKQYRSPRLCFLCV